jgi:hypothetical protein
MSHRFGENPGVRRMVDWSREIGEEHPEMSVLLHAVLRIPRVLFSGLLHGRTPFITFALVPPRCPLKGAIRRSVS